MAKTVGRDKIRYLLFINGRWRWRPTKAMRALGFGLVNLSPGDKDAQSDPVPTHDDIRRAVGLNVEWDRVRFGGTPLAKPKTYPAGSVGDGYTRAMALRKAERLARGVIWTKEQESRDDWPRAWKWLEPEFADCDPKTIVPEHFMRMDSLGAVRGLVPKIEAGASITERHRTIKVWRALWVKMTAMGGYTGNHADPSKSFANSAPKPRDASWQRREVLVLVQRAWREGYHGLAACMAVAWDSMLSPVDVRTLTAVNAQRDSKGLYFALGRAKTGRSAAATLTRWSEAILLAYLERLGVELSPAARIFRNRSGAPYSKDTLGDDFRAVRELCAKGDRRQLADMRRSGAIEGDAGGGSVTDQSNKMANTVAANNRLRKTYNPVNVASVRRFDEARATGARILEQRPAESVTAPGLVTLLRIAVRAKPLK